MINERSHNVTKQELQEALSVAATLVQLDGAVYLPIFKRLKEELDKMIDQDTLMQEALKLASNIESHATQNVTQNVTHR
jgi:hypothetical protein